VDITVEHADQELADEAIDAAFLEIASVQKLMSFHDPASEVSHLNRRAFQQDILVSPHTFQVLERAQEIYKMSGGVFDITASNARTHQYSGNSDDVLLMPGRRVRFLRPLHIDLGGIAKGFAVDQAIEVLQAKGILNGLVNAGGDMRCFGEQERSVWVRHPRNPGTLMPLPSLKNAALATSANSYPRRFIRQISASGHVHGRTRRNMRRLFSVSVRASSCLLADALTKVVLALGESAEPVLNKLAATAFIVYPDNRIACYEGKALI
jgi:thiamine biosynthesis lipoprotein